MLLRATIPRKKEAKMCDTHYITVNLNYQAINNNKIKSSHSHLNSTFAFFLSPNSNEPIKLLHLTCILTDTVLLCISLATLKFHELRNRPVNKIFTSAPPESDSRLKYMRIFINFRQRLSTTSGYSFVINWRQLPLYIRGDTRDALFSLFLF